MAKTGLKLTDMPEADLIKAALEGDSALSQAAFFTLYTRYNKGVRSHISRYVQDSEEVEDIFEEDSAFSNDDEALAAMEFYDSTDEME